MNYVEKIMANIDAALNERRTQVVDLELRKRVGEANPLALWIIEKNLRGNTSAVEEAQDAFMAARCVSQWNSAIRNALAYFERTPIVEHRAIGKRLKEIPVSAEESVGNLIASIAE